MSAYGSSSTPVSAADGSPPVRPERGDFFSRKAERMHRRAQRAEGRLEALERDLQQARSSAMSHWRSHGDALNQLHALSESTKHLRLTQPDPLARIIALGEEYP